MEIFHPDINGLSRMKGRLGFKTHPVFTMIYRLRSEFAFFADIRNLNGYGILPPCVCSFFLDSHHKTPLRRRCSSFIDGTPKYLLGSKQFIPLPYHDSSNAVPCNAHLPHHWDHPMPSRLSTRPICSSQACVRWFEEEPSPQKITQSIQEISSPTLKLLPSLTPLHWCPGESANWESGKTNKCYQHRSRKKTI